MPGILQFRKEMSKVGSDRSLQITGGMGGWIPAAISYRTRSRGCEMKLAGITFKTKKKVDFWN